MSDDADNDSTTAEPAVIPDRKDFSFASTEDGKRFNTLRFPLIPIDCWRLDAPGFAFDSSMVSPAFKGELTTLGKKVTKHPGCPAVLFGHCDPAGDDDLNKTLGDRRAIAIYGLLTRDPDLWAYLYDNPAVGDTWGTRAIQSMLNSLVDSTGAPYYSGKIDGDYGSGTTAGVKRFQSDHGKPKPPTGQADAATRRLLFTAYMEWLCTPDDPSTPALKMAPADFLGGAAAKAGDLPKMSLQGCSEFNPIILLSTAEMKAGGEKRNADNAPNRRIVMYWFKEGTTVTPAEWPCPKVKESAAACKKAFWPDGETRRKSGKDLRDYKQTRDTMACRFYDRFARRSPCEGSAPPVRIRWIVEVPSWASDEVQLMVYDTGHQVVAQFAQSEATVLQKGWLSFDFSKLDQNASLTVELHSQGACITPPVQIRIASLIAESAPADKTSSGDAYAFNSLVQSPEGTAIG